VRNVAPPRKENANQRNVRNALKQGPCRNRKRKNLPVAVAPAKNNYIQKGPCLFTVAGAFLFFSANFLLE
jgi:hypothetical protein